MEQNERRIGGSLSANVWFAILIGTSFLLLETGCDGVARAFQPVTKTETGKWTPKEPNDETPAYEPSGGGGSVVAARQSVVESAKAYLGTKYIYGGTTPKGFDCSGFTGYVFDKHQISLPRVSADQEQFGDKRSMNKVKPGDLIFFRRTRMGKVFHVAIVVGAGSNGIEVIHSTSSGVRIDNITTNSYWKTKHASARNVLGAR